MKMKKVKVVKVNRYDCILEDKDGKQYRKNIQFYDVTIEEGDYIYIDERVLEEINLYAYGPLLEESNVEDLIKIVKDGKDIYLQRYYG